MNITRISTAARWLDVATSTICSWKRRGLVSDPGRGKVDYDEAKRVVKQKPADDLGEPTVKTKRKESKSLGIEQCLRPAKVSHNGTIIYLHEQ